MSKFFEDLWESIFTPGPTPTLLIATNVTFAVLQVVLFVLLLATYSIHFIILSGLSAGLWWAINWFARELTVARELQEKEEAEQKRKDRRRAVVAAATAASGAESETTDNETEVDTAARATGASGRGEVRQRAAATTNTPSTPAAAAGPPAQASQGSQTSQTSQASSQGLSGNRSGVNTEDEWDKVSENEQ